MRLLYNINMKAAARNNINPMAEMMTQVNGEIVLLFWAMGVVLVGRNKNKFKHNAAKMQYV